MIRRRIAVIAVLLAAAACLFGQGGNEKKESTQAGPVEIQLWHRWGGGTEQKLNEVVAAFEAENPDIKVNVTAKPGEYMDLLQKMIADLAAGNNPPDILIGGYNLLNYIGTELKPNTIDELAPSKEAYAAFCDKYEPAVLNLGNMGGKQIGAPFAMSNMVLFCNMDIFRAAGLSEKDIPDTWDDVFRIGKIIKEKTGKWAIGTQFVDTWPDLTLIFSNGGKLLSDDGTRVAFNNPEAKEAIATWQRCYNEKLTPLCTDDELMADFSAGNLAMYNTSCMKLGALRQAADFDMQVGKTPAFGTKPRALPAGGSAIICFSRDKAKKDAVWKFIDFATSEEAMKIFTQTGYLCVTKAKVPVNPGQEAAYAQVPNAVQWLCWPGGATGLEIEKIYHTTRTKVIQENVPVGPAYDKLADECNALLK